jgi:hypothetical protein
MQLKYRGQTYNSTSTAETSSTPRMATPMTKTLYYRGVVYTAKLN